MLLGLVLTASLLAGCAAPVADHAAACAPVSLTADREVLRDGENVTLVARVTNCGAQPVEHRPVDAGCALAGTEPVGVRVAGPNGAGWLPDAGAAEPDDCGSSQAFALQPGESKERALRWNGTMRACRDCAPAWTPGEHALTTTFLQQEARVVVRLTGTARAP